MREFTHLQVHSHFSLLGGTASVAELSERAAADGMSHLALTDSNCMYGVVAFDTACRAVGVQSILGMTLAVEAAEPSRSAAEKPPKPIDHGVTGGEMDGAGHLVLLAMNPDGYRSLCRVSSALQGRPTRERQARTGIDWETLKANRSGLVCVSGGRRGWLEHYLRAGHRNAAYRYAGYLAGIFGENTYLSLALHDPSDEEIAREVVGLGNRLGIPVVAVQPVYCLLPQDTQRLDLLAAIDLNCRLENAPSAALPARGDLRPDRFWLSPDEVAQRFAEFPQAVAAVGDIVKRSEPALPRGGPIWPAVRLPQGRSADEALADAAREGMAQRCAESTTTLTDLCARLEHELLVIARHGYAPLFLVVADITRFARENRIPYGTRGSVANSLVAYCSGITTIDPIAHGLLFERFLSPDRSDPPDIDLNFCSRRRDEVLEYLREKYGENHVALVSTINTMGRKSAVRETAKAYGLDEKEISRLMASLPREWLSRWHRSSETSMDEFAEGIVEPTWRRILRAALALVGQPHHLSLHPGGAVVTPGPLSDFFPVQWTPKGFLATQFGQEELKVLGVPKVDLLGVRALTVLSSAEDLVQRHYDAGFGVEMIPIPVPRAQRGTSEHNGDPKTGDQLERAETIGVFQCESSGARLTQRKLRTRTVFDLAVANAFFKPAPALGGMAQDFVRRYRGEVPMALLHPALEPILGQTKGVILFQEQVLRVAREVAGLSWAEAHALRRGGFSAEELDNVHQRFIEGCQQLRQETGSNGLSKQQAETLWEQVTAFSGFSLNQGHAAAYADLSYAHGVHQSPLACGVFVCAFGRLGWLSPPGHLHCRSSAPGHPGEPTPRKSQPTKIHTRSAVWGQIRRSPQIGRRDSMDGTGSSARSTADIDRAHSRTTGALPFFRSTGVDAARSSSDQRDQTLDSVWRVGWV